MTRFNAAPGMLLSRLRSFDCYSFEPFVHKGLGPNIYKATKPYCACRLFLKTDQRLYDMNGIFQMQGGKNRILPKYIIANRFCWDSHWLEIWSNHFCPSLGPNGGSVATDSVKVLGGRCLFIWSPSPRRFLLGVVKKFFGSESGHRWTGEKVEGRLFTRGVENTKMTDCISSL